MKNKEYNNELLFLYSKGIKLYLDKCSIDDNYVNCTINKDEIEELLEHNNQKFEIHAYKSYLQKVDLVYDIYINDTIYEKQDIIMHSSRFR